MELHQWTQDLFVGAGIPDRLNHVTSCQRYKCRNCDETITIPDCYIAGKQVRICLTLLSLGCKRDLVRPKIERKQKAPYEDKKDYPAKKGKR